MKKQKKAFITRLAVFLLILSALFFVPLPYNVNIPCEIKATQRAILYVKSEGYLKHLNYQDGDTVSGEDELLVLDNPFLQMDLDNKLIERKILEEELNQLSASSATQYQRKTKLQQLKSLDTVIDELKTKLGHLRVKAAISGKAIHYHPDVELGKWLERGTAFGEVFTNKSQVIYGYLNEDNLHQVRSNEKVKLFFAKDTQPITGTILAIQDVPLKNLESTPLQDVYGGQLKGRKQGGGWQSIHVLYQVLIKPDQSLEGFAVGRTGVATCQRSFSLGAILTRKVLNFFQKEKVF